MEYVIKHKIVLMHLQLINNSLSSLERIISLNKKVEEKILEWNLKLLLIIRGKKNTLFFTGSNNSSRIRCWQLPAARRGNMASI